MDPHECLFDTGCVTTGVWRVHNPRYKHYLLPVELTLSGVVTRFDYLNPHAWLYVNVENDDGTFTEWGFELGAPPRLRRSGISPKFWREGDAVTLKTNPLKDGRPAGNLRGAINGAGKTFGNADGLQPPAD